MNGPVWTPTAATRARGDAARGRIAFVQGTPLTSDNVADIQRPIAPGLRVLAAWIKARWGLSSVGMARGGAVRGALRRPDGTLRRRDVHEEGRALDAMTTDVRKGTEIAETLVFYAQELGVQYVIWRRTEWASSSVGAAWEPYRGTSDHADHVHAELTPATAADEDHVRAALARIDAALGGGSFVPPRSSATPRSSPPSGPAPATSTPPASAPPAPSVGAAPAGAALLALGAAGWLLWRVLR